MVFRRYARGTVLYLWSRCRARDESNITRNGIDIKRNMCDKYLRGFIFAIKIAVNVYYYFFFVGLIASKIKLSFLILFI